MKAQQVAHPPVTEIVDSSPALGDVVAGGAAGLLATGLMSLVMLAMKRLLPVRAELPPSEIVATARHKAGLGRQTRAAHGLLTVAGHFGYGAAAAVPYAVLSARRKPVVPLQGALYGLAVWMISYLGLLPALRLYPPPEKDLPERTSIMVVSHLVWGAGVQLFHRRLHARRQ